MWTLFRIALRNVVRNRRRTLITLAAILVGVGVLVTIRGLMNGLQHALISGVVEGQTGAIQIHRKGYLKNVLSSPLTLDFPVDEAFQKKVLAVPGVAAVTPRIAFVGMASSGDDTLVLQAIAVDPKTEFTVCPKRSLAFDADAHFGMTNPKPPPGWAPGDPPPIDDGVILSKELAKGIKLKPGVLGAILAPDRDGALSGENIEVAGLMTGFIPGQEKVGIVPLVLAQRLLKMEGRATELAVAVKRIEDVPRVSAELQKVLGPEYEVVTWHDVAVFVDTILGRQEFMVTLIGSIFMILMLLGVANTMLMSVFERTREIGTMMAVGVTRRKIIQMFLFEAAGLGLLGAFIGIAAGTAAVVALHAHGIVVPAPGTHVPFTIRPSVTTPFLIFVAILASVGAVVFASYPAWRASRLRPVEALAGA
jgi:putative ABC transport system permease protein